MRGRIDGNTVQGRRVRRRWRQYVAKLVEQDDALQRAFAADAAELAIAIEDVQGQAVAGDKKAADLLVRMRNELRRAEAKLQFRDSKAQPHSIDDLLHSVASGT